MLTYSHNTKQILLNGEPLELLTTHEVFQIAMNHGAQCESRPDCAVCRALLRLMEKMVSVDPKRLRYVD